MAKVFGQVAGGRPEEKNANNIGDLRSQMELASSYTATINGEPSSSDTQSLSDYDVVIFAPAVKGA